MADYAISNVPRRVVYAPSGVGPYAFTFEILSQTDIAVYKASTLLTLTTDYTVTINANGTGSVTLVTTAGTSNITIVGAKNIQRTTDFTTGGDLFANTLNDELDNQTIFIQQVAETAERGLKAPVVDPTDINMTLPAKASRVGTVLAFNATTGNPEAGPSIGSVTTVAAQSANINTVAANIGSVNTVAGNTSNINTVAGVSGNVTTVASNIANVNAVGADLLEGVSEINTVAVDIANVNNVGNNISNVNTVAGISANVTSVAGNSSNINTVAGNNANVTTVAGISGNVTTVAGISANVTTVAGINAAVSTVATNNANVSTVATNIASVNTNATNIVAIQNASTNATNAATSATAAQTAQSAAESARDATLAAYDNFDDRYLGSKTTNPTLDNDGNALVAGALYFNSVSGAMQVYTGSAWVAAYVSGTGFLASANNLSDVASTSSARTNLGLGTIATQAASSVAITGGAINGTTIGATTASTGAFSTLSATGVTTVQAGTVSLPAITTTGDTNTGIYFPAADTIAFTEGGVEALRLNSNSQTATSIAGTASLPSFTRNGDENTGIFFPAADTIAFTEGGTEAMRLDSSGNLGIGTTSPAVRFHTQGGRVRFDANSENFALQLNNSTIGNGPFLGSAGADIFVVSASSGSERMRIDSSGQVGIGTSSPTALLHVNGTARATSMSLNGVAIGDYNLYSGMVTRVANGGGIGINSANASDNAYIYFGSGTSSGAQQSAAIGRIGGDVLSLFTAGTERMRITSGGQLRTTVTGTTMMDDYGCRAWVNFNGTGTVAIRASGNVSSITDNSTGNYNLNFTTAMPDDNYATCGVSTLDATGTGSGRSANCFNPRDSTTSSVKILVVDGTSGNTIDAALITVSIFR